MPSGVIPLRAYLFAGLIALGGTGFEAIAGEAETIEQAKRELDTLQETTQPMGNADLHNSLPRLAGPESPSLASPPISIPFTKKADDKLARRNPNWLVEAMLNDSTPKKHAGERIQAGSGAESEEDKGLTPMERLIADQLRAMPVAGTEQIATEIRNTEELKSNTINPLDRFMTEWISARDQELLLPDHEPGRSGAFSPERSLQPSTQDANLSMRMLAEGAPATTNNPYLVLQPIESTSTGWEGIKAPLPAVNFSPVPPPVAVTNGFGNRHEEKEPFKATLPPLLTKPEEDARYFPQLKRF